MHLEGNDILQEIAAEYARKKNSFPRNGSLDYPAVITGWIAQLEAFLLPYVTAGAIAAASAKGVASHLTMHDKEHVTRVRQVASNLVENSVAIDLSHFELTLLLVAIYLHDVGNIVGRDEHEKNIHHVLTAAGKTLQIDSVEYATAKQIAGVHGGTVNGSKDTISTLQESSAVSSKRVRLRLLAAMLRLADELADDTARANQVQLAAGMLPPGSEVYHVVAAGLHSQMPDARTREIELKFAFYDPRLFQRELGKDGGQVHLLDEIFARSIKTFNEARYCSRFMRPYLEFERVKVDIMIFDDQHEELHNIVYTIAENGYGDLPSNIYELVPELSAYRGNGKLTAAHLMNLIAAAQGERT
jgi:hypothetical protein